MAHGVRQRLGEEGRLNVADQHELTWGAASVARSMRPSSTVAAVNFGRATWAGSSDTDMQWERQYSLSGPSLRVAALLSGRGGQRRL